MNGNPRGETRWAGVFRFGKKAVSVGSKMILGLLTCAVLFIFFKATTRAPAAKADSSVYYPSFCLGGWRNPQNASGPSDLPAGDTSASDFTTDNSAYLASDVSSQIFCGYFSVDDQPTPPSKVTISFNWSDGVNQTPPATQTQTQTQTQTTSPSIASSTQTTSSSSGGGSLSSSSGLIIATSTGFIVSTSTPDTSTTSTTPATSTTSAVSTTSDDTDVSNPPAAPADAPSSDASSSAPAASDESSSEEAPQSDASTSPTSFLYKVLDHFAKVASADSSGFSPNAFFQISYSTDGVNWITAGTVSETNFQNYSITVPISSWDDLKNLQIMIQTIPSVDQKPDVYLESIALNVSYGSSILGDVEDSAAAIDAAANAAADALNNIVQPAAPQVPSAPPPPAMTWVKKVSFDFSTNETATQRNLPWYPRDFSKAAMSHSFSSNLSLKKNSDGSSLVVSGTCDATDFVVLIYRSPTDYINHPASFLYDAANPCNPDGTFDFDIASLSLNIPDGTYSLLIGSEGNAGTWIPISPVVPITIHSQSVQVPVSSIASTTQSQ